MTGNASAKSLGSRAKLTSGVLQVVVDPLLWPHADYLSGSLIQLHILASEESGASSMLAAGHIDAMPFC